ncbi:MAG: hypothetical protein ACFB10_01775 [Salibacteraceae bacterium]
MITLVNADSFEVDWYVCPRFMCDTNHATAAGKLAAGASVTLETDGPHTVLWAFGMKFAAGVGCQGDSVLTFQNDETGTWCAVSESKKSH